jgi:hypothetical protein
VYVFHRWGTSWPLQAYLQPPSPRREAYFGSAVSISGDTLIAGAPGEPETSAGEFDHNAGAAYVFVRNGTSWSQQARLRLNNGLGGSFFGQDVALSGNTAVIGALGTGIDLESPDPPDVEGAAFVFVRNGTQWSTQATLRAGNAMPYARFGTSVGISGDAIIVGATHEDSGVGGANANPLDISLPDAGAAYLFTRSAGAWNQSAYLKASNPGEEDWFGGAVAIASNTIVVGAHFEDSAALGVNGNQSDDSLYNVGAAYVFHGCIVPRSPLECWRELHFGSPDNVGPGANFSDADHDQVPNLIEYAFALDPRAPSSAQLPSGQWDGQTFVMSFTKPDAVTGVIYGAEWSATLETGTWQPLPNLGTGADYRFSLPSGIGDGAFMRLKVTED